jgi:hypothetical protein
VRPAPEGDAPRLITSDVAADDAADPVQSTFMRLTAVLVVLVATACGSNRSAESRRDAGAAEPEIPDATAAVDRHSPDSAAHPADARLPSDLAADVPGPPAPDARPDTPIDTASPDAAPAACTPQPAGQLVDMGDVVFDPRTCLSWMKATKDMVNLNPDYPPDSLTYCGGLGLGGFHDWRVPTVSELASIITRCGKYPPEGPWDPLFEVKGDGYWTTTSAGAPHKVCAIGTANAGKFYEYGTDGPQVVRCVRGTGKVKTARDCTTGATCANWYQ